MVSIQGTVANSNRTKTSKHSHTQSKFVNENPNEYMVNKVNNSTSEADKSCKKGKNTASDYPCIDISPWVEPSGSKSEKDMVVKAILECAKDCGSFNISGHGVPKELFEKLETHSLNFFRQPLSEKERFTGGSNRGGYVGVLKESVNAVYGLKDGVGDLRETYSTITPLEKADTNVEATPSYQKAIEDYVLHMERLDVVLHELLTEALEDAKGISLPAGYLERAKGGSGGMLRCCYYPAHPIAENEAFEDEDRLRAHSDWGPLTILFSSTKGLEEVRNGNWVPVPVPKHQELHVVLGDVMHIWSNGIFENNVHRVSSHTSDDRISFAYFAAQGVPGPDEVGIEPVCSAGEAPRFGKVASSEHTKNYLDTYFGCFPNLSG